MSIRPSCNLIAPVLLAVILLCMLQLPLFGQNAGLYIKIVAPEKDSTVSTGEPLAVMVVTNIPDIVNLAVMCDDKAVCLIDRSPYEANIDTANLSSGSHSLWIRVYVKDGKTYKSSSVLFSVLAEETQPVTALSPPAADVNPPTIPSHPQTPTETTAEIAKRCLPSVVLVTIYDENERPIGSGSGFTIGGERVVTAYHVVAGGVSAYVKTAEKIMYPVSSVIAADAGVDLAVLQVKKMTDVPLLPLGDSSAVALGESVVAIGSPLGLEGTITEGVVSAIRESSEYKTEVIQYSAPSSPGNSGGPLVNGKGEVVGIISHQMRLGQNLNFAIPVNRLPELLSQPSQPRDVSILKGLLLSEIGSLPPKRKTAEFDIPNKEPFTVFPGKSWHKWSEESVTISIDKRRLRKVDSEKDIVPGTFYVTTTGVLKFHSQEKGKKATVDVEFTPLRVALLIESDGTSQLESALAERFNKLGDEVLTGAEVQAAVAQWQPQAVDKADSRKLALQLSCSRLVIARCDSQDLKGWTETAVVHVTLEVYDLNTGQQIMSGSSSASKNVGFRSWRSTRRRALNAALDAFFKRE